MVSSAERVAAFEAMVRSHDASLRRFGFRLVGGDIDDVLQTAYLAAFRAMDEFRGESSSGTWLHRIVYTSALNHLRSRRRSMRREELAAGTTLGSDVAGDVSARVDLARVVDALPVDQRAVLVLVDGQGFSYEEASVVLGVGVGTIASRLSRARTRVRSEWIMGGKD